MIYIMIEGSLYYRIVIIVRDKLPGIYLPIASITTKLFHRRNRHMGSSNWLLYLKSFKILKIYYLVAQLSSASNTV